MCFLILKKERNMFLCFVSSHGKKFSNEKKQWFPMTGILQLIKIMKVNDIKYCNEVIFHKTDFKALFY